MIADIIVIFEDDEILVINKPAGMVVNRAKSVKGITVQDWIGERVKLKVQSVKLQRKIQKFKSEILNQVQDDDSLETNNLKPARNAAHSAAGGLVTNFDWDEVNRELFYQRNGIVHRLDKETSGVLVMAKTEEAYIDLLKQFRERTVKKGYLALVHGRLDSDQGTIDEPIGRLPWNRKRFGVLPGGRTAVTKYKVFRVIPEKAGIQNENESYSLLEMKPQTGRTHQIRVHMKHIGHPLVGDELYAGRKTARQDRKWCQRLFLHARSLEFQHPKAKKKVKFEADLDEELKGILAVLAYRNSG